MVKIRMYPAKNGDAFLVLATSPTNTAILIDGGYGETFHTYIRGDLQALAANGNKLDLVIASHIDADHVVGLIEFFKFNGNSSTPSLIAVDSVWHNSVRSISEGSFTNVGSEDLSILKAAASRGYPASSRSETVREISAGQGSTLGAALLAGNYHWNDGEGKTSVSSDAGLGVRRLAGANIEVLGPTKARLAELEIWWKAELRRLGYAASIGAGEFFDDAFEFMCANSDLRKKMASSPREISAPTALATLPQIYSPDTSITNASSISVVIAVGGKSLLFLGDSLAEDLVEKLGPRLHGQSTLWFDAIKISHHGSLHNTSPGLLKIIDSDTFFISSNGDRHGHPDFAVLREIVDRPAKFKRTLHFSYSTPASRQLKNYCCASGAEFAVNEGATDWVIFS